MKKVIMLKGLPASGKSSYAKEQCGSDVVRVNKDDIRAMMASPFSKGNENIVLAVRDTLVREALSQNKTVFVDDTNFAPIHEETLRTIAAAHDAPFEIKTFDTPVDECIKRDAKRANPVGRDVIMDMYRKYIKQIPEPREYRHDLPNAIIVDIDGTLAHMKDRSPYDYSKVDTDYIDPVVLDLVLRYSGNHDVLIVSGRKFEAFNKTWQWLRDNEVPFLRIFMRDDGDDRPDYIVKKEIYDNNIKDYYNVNIVLDDRDQVVRMWREEGLKCLQVAEGNF